jgi:phospholipid/cholesterol/gamma-HCH transport system substrate-binding protein
MNERVMQFRVGLVVLATFLIGAILVMSFMGSTPLLRGKYTIYVKFNEAPGITRDTPVLKSGIRIGQVRNVQFGDNDEGVIVTADIDRDRHVYRDEECLAVSSLLLGDTSLEFVHVPGTPHDRTPIEAGAIIKGKTGPDMTGSITGLQKQAVRTLDTMDKAGQDLHVALSRIDRLVASNEDKFTRLLDETDETMKLLKQTLIASNDIVGDPKLRDQIKQTIREMPEILAETRTTVQRMSGTFASLEKNMHNIEGLTKPLGEHGETLVGEAGESMHRLNLLTENLLRFSQQVNDDNGSLGAVLHNRELYDRVNKLLADLDGLTRDVKPILNNVAIFSDKIARHPSELGVRGALHKDSGVKDVPTDENGQPTQPQARRWPLGGSGSWSIGQGR